MNKIYIDYDTWRNKVTELCSRIKDKDYRYVYGVPRGGSLIAVFIRERLKLVLLEKPPKNKMKCIVVDDLIDSGATRNKFKEFDFEVLIDKQKDKITDWIEFWYESTGKDIHDVIIRQLEYIGEDPNRPGLIDTPKRVVKSWNEIFSGYSKDNIPKLTAFNNGQDELIYDEMICDEGDFYSMCEHHILPIINGKYYFAYIPHKKGMILGLSKVARVVDYFSKRLQVQERLTEQIVNHIWSSLCDKNICKYPPLAMGLVLEGEHLCKTMRGVKKKGKMRTTILRGTFKTDSAARQEFMDWVNKNGAY